MSDKIFHYKHYHQIDLLLKEFKDSNPQEFMKSMGKWRRSFKVGSYGEFIKHHYTSLVNGKVGVGYYHQLSGEEVNPHTDTRCLCRINIKLSNDDTNVVIGDEKFKYDCALLNVSKYEHYVEKCNTDRILFSIMFVDKDFETVKNYLS